MKAFNSPINKAVYGFLAAGVSLSAALGLEIAVDPAALAWISAGIAGVVVYFIPNKDTE